MRSFCLFLRAILKKFKKCKMISHKNQSQHKVTSTEQRDIHVGVIRSWNHVQIDCMNLLIRIHCERSICKTVDPFFGVTQSWNDSLDSLDLSHYKIWKSRRAAHLNQFSPIQVSHVLNQKFVGSVNESLYCKNSTGATTWRIWGFLSSGSRAILA